jgi:hypothetical protein
MKSEKRNIGGTTTILVTPFHSAAYPMSALVRNMNPGTIYVGGKDVSTANGFPIQLNESFTFDVVNEPVYAVATVTTTIHVLRRGD